MLELTTARSLCQVEKEGQKLQVHRNEGCSYMCSAEPTARHLAHHTVWINRFSIRTLNQVRLGNTQPLNAQAHDPIKMN